MKYILKHNGQIIINMNLYDGYIADIGYIIDEEFENIELDQDLEEITYQLYIEILEGRYISPDYIALSKKELSELISNEFKFEEEKISIVKGITEEELKERLNIIN